MTTFPTRWAPRHPDRLQLYSMATPNGQKIAIALEELELPYEPHRIDILARDQFDPDFVALSPNSKIPAILDPAGPGGAPLALAESGAILLYLAEKTGRLIPPGPHARWETIQWLMFQMSAVGPFLGQFGHFFKFARGKTADTYALDRYTKEARRLLDVLERRLDGRAFLVGDELSIADISTFPWIAAIDFYGGRDALDVASLPHVGAWLERCMTRPAVQRGLKVNA